ncbi:hypothetical protein LPH56_09220 [Xylella taiwanensis]|nr:hypothetical protein [Xylella taiwanensis]MCD8470540.1 hypothetical protein [Xylella taiwanensis]MCD8473613.1 hypothetical protein [Xylella taiwanensis]UFN41009.1 hypothetical protein LPH57_10150 [Xylella taiwanensis]UFS49148.1 hypothetical protein LPH54_09205 [Xylella taiwanensis]UFS51440.1 hypothetical protein LPH56_09220 [Xylella taiwanensis]
MMPSEILHGEQVDNPAASVRAASMTTFVPKERALSLLEISLLAPRGTTATYPRIPLALRMILLLVHMREFDAAPP